MTGPFAFSVTKFISCVTMDRLTLCDTPGFEDSQGAEVDIANGVGVVEGIRRCKSVIPAIVVSYKSTGERYSGIKSLTTLIASMFNDIPNNIESFLYIFTKFSPDQKEEVVHILKNIIDTLTEEEKSDEAFVLLLEDMH